MTIQGDPIQTRELRVKAISSGDNSTTTEIAVRGDVAMHTSSTFKTKNITQADSSGLNITNTAAEKVGHHGVTPVILHSTTGDVTGFAAGGGTASKSDSTWDGAAGSTSYTVGDIVTALKAVGLLTA